SLSAWCDRPVDLRFRSRLQGLFLGRLAGEARLCRLDGRLPQLRLFDAREDNGRTGGEKSAGDPLVSGAARHRSDGQPHQADPWRAESDADRLVLGRYDGWLLRLPT